MSASLFDRLTQSDNRTLTAIFATAPPPTFDSLVGFEWRGFNTDPSLRFLGLRKFMKAFFRGVNGDEGCNVKVAQNTFAGPWLPRTRRGRTAAFAFYLVRAQDERTRLRVNPRALLIDYAASPRNPVWHVERLIRDYIVAPSPDEPNVVLGRAYLGIGRVRIASSFFVIERFAPLPSDVP